MSDRVILPKSDIVGTKEWAERLVDAIKADHRYSERDVSLFAEHAAEAKLNKIWETTAQESWNQFCVECLNLPAAYVDAIVVGVGTLRGTGYSGPIPASQAQRVAAQAQKAEDAEPIPKRGTIGNGRRDSNNYVYGNDRGADYLTARIARDRPDILEDMKQGKYRSVRQAAIEAGIVTPSTRYSLPSDPIAAAHYLAQRVDKEWLQTMVDELMKQIATQSPRDIAKELVEDVETLKAAKRGEVQLRTFNRENT